MGIVEAEILAQASGGQEFVQGLLLIALVAASVQSMETRPKEGSEEDVWSGEQQQLLGNNRGSEH